MGKLPEAPFEVRLAATLFLLLLGFADAFGALQVRNFAAFTPRGVAAAVSSGGDHSAAGGAERPIDLAELNAPRHHIDRELLVQDTHVHVPAYAMTAGFLSMIVLGLRLGSRQRSALILLLFAAPLLDFVGLWGAHLSRESGDAWAAVALAGGYAMGIGYLFVLLLTLAQCWFAKKGVVHA
jgi:hypothetical protein